MNANITLGHSIELMQRIFDNDLSCLPFILWFLELLQYELVLDTEHTFIDYEDLFLKKTFLYADRCDFLSFVVKANDILNLSY